MPDHRATTPPISLNPLARVIWIWGPALAVMAAIFAVSSLEDITTLPGEVPDKVGHFLGYFLLGLMVLRATAGARWHGVTTGSAVRAWLVCVLYGASDEWHQSFVPSRTAALDDWVADAAGSAAAILCLWLVARLPCLRGRTV
jgi:VanZ family protein